MSNHSLLSERLEKVFAKTKLVCFGRYALEVPDEAELIIGDNEIEVVEGGVTTVALRVAEDIHKIKLAETTAQIVHNDIGSSQNIWLLRYYEDKFSKASGTLTFKTYVSHGDLTYILRDSADEVVSATQVINRQMRHAKNVRPREANEIPRESGYCFTRGFMAENLYDEQEMSNAGIFLPSFPDVTFSISSNKDAYGDLSHSDFEKRMRPQLSLLSRIKQAKIDQPGTYPQRKMLRERNRDVNHWHGEESLFVRDDGTHDFEWALVGNPGDIATPSVLSAVMFTKVEDDVIGAASAPSLSDLEAVALFDRLLSGLKFRVKVPGAPLGSYLYESDGRSALKSQENSK